MEVLHGPFVLTLGIGEVGLEARVHLQHAHTDFVVSENAFEHC